MIATTEKLQSWLEAFEGFEKDHAAPAWLHGLRQEAFAHFCERGLPTIKDEDWRFTSVQSIANTAFQFARGDHGVRVSDIASYRLDGLACQLVFVNGRYSPELSRTETLPEQVVAGGLAEAIARSGDSVRQHLARYEDFHADSFTALNTAFIADGAFVRIPRGVVLEEPIYLLYLTTASESPLMVHPRNLIICEENSQAGIVEDYVSLGGDARLALCNVVTELVVGDNGVVSHTMVEREDRHACNVSTLRTQQGRSANVASHSVLLGSGLVRNNVHPVLAGEGGDCLINGLFVGSGSQHLDNYMKVEHQAPHCGSRQFYNGILDEHARGVFHGRIIVHKDAQKTDAKQTNRNLLLSDDAQVDTKPQLEIYADDVKCTHGATIGQIDESALFYLRSRGIDEVQARGLLLYAFAHENLDRMKPGVIRTWLEGLVTEWLAASIARPRVHERSRQAESGQGRNRQEGR